MANEPYTITNQKLYFVKLALADWQAIAIESTNISLLKAQQECIVFHLYSTLWALYNEVASYYRFPLLTEPTSLRKWLTNEFIEQNPSPELNELFDLLTTNSFVLLIVRAWENIFNPTPAQNTANNIPVSNIEASLETPAEIEDCLKQLSELITRFRAGLTEY